MWITKTGEGAAPVLPSTAPPAAARAGAAAPDPRVLAFDRALDAAGGVLERLIAGVHYRATRDAERGCVIFSAQAETGPWAVAHAEAFRAPDEACFEGWCMDVGGALEAIDSAEAALLWTADALVEREAAIRAARTAAPEDAADFLRRRPSRRLPAGAAAQPFSTSPPASSQPLKPPRLRTLA